MSKNQENEHNNRQIFNNMDSEQFNFQKDLEEDFHLKLDKKLYIKN